MKSENNSKPKATTRRKAVTQAMSKQSNEARQTLQMSVEEFQDAVRLKAYELYVQRGGENGSAEDDWYIAEQIVINSQK